MFVWWSATKIVQAIWIPEKTWPPGGRAHDELLWSLTVRRRRRRSCRRRRCRRRRGRRPDVRPSTIFKQHLLLNH